MTYELTTGQKQSPNLEAFLHAVLEDKNPTLAEQAFVCLTTTSEGRDMKEQVGSALAAVAERFSGASYQITPSPKMLLDAVEARSPMARRAIENTARMLTNG